MSQQQEGMSERMIPILWEHDRKRVVGGMAADGTITFAGDEGFPDKALPLGLGYRVLEMEYRDGVRYIKKVQVLELSLGKWEGK